MIVGDVTREAEMDGRIDQRFHHEEDVGGAGPGHGRGPRHELLVVHFQLRTKRPEQGSGLGTLLLGRLRRGVPDRHPLAEAGGRVGHAPDDLVVAEEAVAEGLVPPFQGRHLKKGPARNWRATFSPLGLVTRARMEIS